MTLTQDSPPAAPGPAAPTEQARARNRQTSDFFDLQQRVKDAGLLERGASSYIGRALVLTLSFAGAGTLLGLLGDSWWQLAVAALFGVLFTQAAFISHDAAHQQVFNHGRKNEWLARIVGNLVVGLSYGWWVRKHGKHHANPNVVGKDGDISPGFVVFVPEDAQARTGFAAWFARRQGWFLFPLLLFFGMSLHVSAVQTLFTSKKLKHRKAEAAFLVVRLVGFPALILLLLGPGLGIAFLAVQIAVFGVYMGGSFAPNHKGMPLIPKESNIDFLRRQILTSRNVSGGRPMDWAMGGLNYQIEHHLFPRMASPNLHKVRPLVIEFCAERDIPYTETSLIESYGIITRYLNRVGLGYSDPMDCPVAAQFRPRSTDAALS
ncbi:acyl-CoA desaturase [Garicola koreensis]|uniref:fatty acid desaturase family protein n=1 Tax=Garicola koreensis TaxID=1262554 RepID=UPI0031EFF290